jgi:hypothetical protein
LPRIGAAKPALVLLSALILAGCGGQPSSKAQTVRAGDFRFEAPAGWQVTTGRRMVSAANGPVDLVQVKTFTLLKPYRHALLAGAVRELDSDLAKIAALQKGTISSRQTTQVGGHDARSYTIAYGDKLQQLTFVLDGMREFELVCRLPKGADDTPCTQLLATFAVEPA